MTDLLQKYDMRECIGRVHSVESSVCNERNKDYLVLEVMSMNKE